MEFVKGLSEPEGKRESACVSIIGDASGGMGSGGIYVRTILERPA